MYTVEIISLVVYVYMEKCVCYIVSCIIILYASFDHEIYSHVTPASLACVQSLHTISLLGHSRRDDSRPVQLTWSMRIPPDPFPKWAFLCAFTAPLYPSWVHTTWASVRSQKESHTVYHLPSE